jgi:HEPN domain-containing protein
MGPAQWLACARDDLRAAELLAEHGIAQLSCFHSEQAVEKALMALRLYQERARQAEVEELLPPAERAFPDPEAQPVAFEAVQTAQRLVERITEQVYGS